jgi:sulfite reductase alpha subunit
MVGYVLVPFLPIRGPEDYDALGDLFGAFLELWADQAKRKERVGDFVARVGLIRILRELGLKVEPQVVESPQRNVFRPYREAMEGIKGAFYE